jgi:hypothetical protein
VWGALGTWVPFVPFGSSGTNGINVPQDYPVLNVADLWNDPHFRSRNTFIEVDHPLGFKDVI